MTLIQITSRYTVARRTSWNGGPLSLGPFAHGRLKNLGDVKEMIISGTLTVKGMSVSTEFASYLCSLDCSNSSLSPEVKRRYCAEYKYTIQYKYIHGRIPSVFPVQPSSVSSVRRPLELNLNFLQSGSPQHQSRKINRKTLWTYLLQTHSSVLTWKNKKGFLTTT